MADKTYNFRLIIHGPQGYTREFDIPFGITSIGRDPDNTIQLDNPTITRQHARLECVTNECEITDLGSTNGTYINRVAIPPKTPQPLQNGDHIRLGPHYEMTFLQEQVLEEAPASERPEPAPVKEIAGAPGILSKKKTGAQAPPASPPPAPPEQPVQVDPCEQIPPGLSVESRHLLKYLPGIYQTEVMSHFLGIFEAILMPIEWTIDNFDLYLSARTAPSAFLPWLANLYEAEFDNTWSEKQRRQFLEEAWKLYAKRGTKWALSRILEIYTGQAPAIDDLSDDLRPHFFRVSIPVEENSINRDSLENLIHFFKPAHTDYELLFKK